MNDKWTRVNRIAVIVSYCLCVIGLVILAIWSFSTYNPAPQLLVCVAGLVSVTISHLMWAMYIEMSSNIIGLSGRSDREAVNMLSDISQTLGKILSNQSQSNNPNINTPWECCRCGKINPPEAQFCQSCGNQKDKAPVRGSTENLSGGAFKF